MGRCFLFCFFWLLSKDPPSQRCRACACRGHRREKGFLTNHRGFLVTKTQTDRPTKKKKKQHVSSSNMHRKISDIKIQFDIKKALSGSELKKKQKLSTQSLIRTLDIISQTRHALTSQHIGLSHRRLSQAIIGKDIINEGKPLVPL